MESAPYKWANQQTKNQDKATQKFFASDFKEIRKGSNYGVSCKTRPGGGMINLILAKTLAIFYTGLKMRNPSCSNQTDDVAQLAGQSLIPNEQGSTRLEESSRTWPPKLKWSGWVNA